MPDKTYREMNKTERRLHSLESKSFHIVLFSSLILGITIYVVGILLYTRALIRTDVTEAFNLASSAAAIMERAELTEKPAKEVLRIFRSLSDKELAMRGTDVYYAKFAPVTETPEYSELLETFKDFYSATDLFDVYMVMYDENTTSMVYIADPDPELTCLAGEYEPVKKKGMEKFLGWDGTGQLYDFGKTERYGWLCTSGVPLKDAAGETYAFVLADVSLHGIFTDVGMFTLRYFIVMFAVTALLAVYLTYRVENKVIRHVRNLATAVEDLAKDVKEGKTDTDRFSNLEIHTGDQVERLCLALEDLEKIMNGEDPDNGSEDNSENKPEEEPEKGEE